MPEAPKLLMERPVETLKETPNGSSLSETTKVIVQNYSTYHEVKEQLKALQDWYTEQQKIFNTPD
jgi:hypothetical protein